MPHITQNFQYSGLDSNDLKFAVKRAKFPTKMLNIYQGDYIEIYSGFSVFRNGFNTNDAEVWDDQTITFQLCQDKATYTGVKVYFSTTDNAGVSLNAQEIVQQLNANLKQQMQVLYESVFETYNYDGLPTQDFTVQHYYDLITLTLCYNGYFEFNESSGKLSFVYEHAGLDFTFLGEIPSGTGIVIDENTDPVYVIPSGAYDSGNVEQSYQLQSVQVQIYAGRELTEHRQYRLSQIFGMNMANFQFVQGELCQTYSELNSLNAILCSQQYNQDAYKVALDSEYVINATGIMDAIPVKQIFVYSTLVSNYWGQYGAKQPYIYVHQIDAARGSETGESITHSLDFSSKEHIQGLRNGFEIVIKDRFGQDPGLLDDYYIEIAFMFFNI